MKYGHFDNQNCEYVIDRVDLPVSWTNYLGVERMTAVVNHTAGGYLFYQSPEYHRITRFRPNGVPMDRPGDYVYLRDAESGDYWSISWQPVGKPLDQASYRCRHGLSYSVYECDCSRIKASLTLSVPIGEDALAWDIKITNCDDRKRVLDVFTYAELSFHLVSIDNQNYQMSLYCAGSDYQDGAILYDLFYEENGYQYFTGNFEPDGFDTVREKFLGDYHTESDPQAVISGHCSSSVETGGNHCTSLQKHLELAPGESVRLLCFLGEGRLEDARRIREKYRDPARLDEDYAALRNYWQQRQDCFRVRTPDEGMNTMINIWTLYQSEINARFSRFASFIEVGGRTGLGYRDTAQDAMTVIANDPEICRQRILELLCALTAEGYGIHLFEPRWFQPKDPQEKKPFQSPTVIPEPKDQDKVHGIEDACSDDALWLIPTIVEYVKETGDMEFLARKCRYADGGEGSVYEHMARILEFTLRETGSHGIARGLRADWNDCLNLGGGESALVSFLLYEALNRFSETACALGRDQDAMHYQAEAARLRKVCNHVLWDGEWYLRGFTRSGRKIGTHENAEGQIHLESNAWAVLSGCADAEQAEQALASVHDRLATPWGILLNAPAYTRPDEEIGFVTRVYPGLKENSSIFSHPNPWVWAAECRLGHGSRAMEYYHSLTPYYQNDQIEIRQAEPYSYCQFISGKDHSTYGRAHHPFMTGSGGWAYYAVTHAILGIRPDFRRLIIDPCIPADWEGFEVSRIWRGAVYRIHVENRSHSEKGVKQLMLDGKPVFSIPPQPEGTVHEIVAVL
jgi:N,N'-diacetylchitobiose phosphorylase